MRRENVGDGCAEEQSDALTYNHLKESRQPFGQQSNSSATIMFLPLRSITPKRCRGGGGGGIEIESIRCYFSFLFAHPVYYLRTFPFSFSLPEPRRNSGPRPLRRPLLPPSPLRYEPSLLSRK